VFFSFVESVRPFGDQIDATPDGVLGHCVCLVL